LVVMGMCIVGVILIMMGGALWDKRKNERISS
jgi:hypothetical protein